MNAKDQYLLNVVGNAPFKTVNEYRWKAELMLETLERVLAVQQAKEAKPPDPPAESKR